MRSIIIACIVLVCTASSERIEHLFENKLSGVIQSPGYPHSYPAEQHITWIVKVREGYRVKLYFTEFDLEDSYDDDLGGSCVYDYVTIADGDVIAKRYCGGPDRYPTVGPKLQKEIFSTGNSMTITFVSDYSNEPPMPKGFKAHFTEVDRDECWELTHRATQAFEDWDNFLYCNQRCNNVPSTYYCSCLPGFKLHANKHTCTNDCAGKVLRGDTGEITTSSYPRQYSKLAECDWTIQQKEGIAIELRFVDDFSIEKHEDEGCVYDWVQYEHADGFKSDRFCGTEKPGNGDWISTNSPKVIVRFHSDLTLEESGFKLEYKTTRVKCPYSPQTPSNGQITSTIKDLYEFEDVVTFQCDRGYRMIGDKSITCRSDGKWEGKEPECQIKRCGRPTHLESVDYGRIKEDSFELTYGTEVTFLCYLWYEMTSGTSVWRCEDDEKWREASLPVANNANNNIPKCEPICGLKGNKKIRSGRFDFGDVIPNDDDGGDLISPQIYGGKEAKIAEWPWTVFVDLVVSGFQSTDFCGGSLISPNTVVTAAHCTSRTYPHQIRVYVGMTDRTKKADHVQEFTVREVIEHEGFSYTFDSDIAVLKLNGTVKMGKYARPICLPRSKREVDLPVSALQEEEGFHKTGIIVGWGITETGFASFDLRMARIPPIEHKDCVKHVNFDDDYGIKITDNMLCAGFLEGKRDSCRGDSGGPYMFRDKVQNRYFLNGLVSFGSSDDDNCRGKTFGIYTDVSKFVPWLETFLQDY